MAFQTKQDIANAVNVLRRSGHLCMIYSSQEIERMIDQWDLISDPDEAPSIVTIMDHLNDSGYLTETFEENLREECRYIIEEI